MKKIHISVLLCGLLTSTNIYAMDSRTLRSDGVEESSTTRTRTFVYPQSFSDASNLSAVAYRGSNSNGRYLDLHPITLDAPTRDMVKGYRERVDQMIPPSVKKKDYVYTAAQPQATSEDDQQKLSKYKADLADQRKLDYLYLQFESNLRSGVAAPKTELAVLNTKFDADSSLLQINHQKTLLAIQEALDTKLVHKRAEIYSGKLQDLEKALRNAKDLGSLEKANDFIEQDAALKWLFTERDASYFSEMAIQKATLEYQARFAKRVSDFAELAFDLNLKISQETNRNEHAYQLELLKNGKLPTSLQGTKTEKASTIESQQPKLPVPSKDQPQINQPSFTPETLTKIIVSCTQALNSGDLRIVSASVGNPQAKT